MHIYLDRLKKSILPLSLTLALSACNTPPPPITETPTPSPSSTPVQNLEGVTLNVLTEVGPTISEPLKRRAPDFERLTGVKINIITVIFIIYLLPGVAPSP